MQVTALAEALVSSRHGSGSVSLEDLRDRLSRAGLEELARAVDALARRAKPRKQNVPQRDKHPWF